MTKRKRTPRLPRWVMASFDDMVQAAQKHANSYCNAPPLDPSPDNWQHVVDLIRSPRVQRGMELERRALVRKAELLTDVLKHSDLNLRELKRRGVRE